MKVEINNRGSGNDTQRLILEPSSDSGNITLSVFRLDYDLSKAISRIAESKVTVSIEDLKAGVDSLVKVCRKKKGL